MQIVKVKKLWDEQQSLFSKVANRTTDTIPKVDLLAIEGKNPVLLFEMNKCVEFLEKIAGGK